MEGKRVRSKNEQINKGYFQGLMEEVHKRTGITKPVIYQAIRENDTTSPKKLIAVQTALKIIEERNAGLQVLQEPVADYGALDPSGSYTYWDYLRWQFKERVELIRGRMFKMAPAPSANHQTVSLNLGFEVFAIFRDQPCRVFVAPFDVRLPVPNAEKDSTVVQPDLCIICDEAKIDSRGCIGVPDLVMEILSDSNQQHDLNRKYELYEACGVSEYWIVQPRDKLVSVYSLQNGKYQGSRPYTTGMQIESLRFPELKIMADAVFYRTFDKL